ncbi:hypothetical protein CL634_07725 [bacterium]|nr:hypothetical protein [bacterium]|tara:strand:+ start:2570 stop:3301 length:732 start_codon:yes stop_codon:yes gene_type:complete
METSIYKDTWDKIQNFQSWRGFISRFPWDKNELSAVYQFGVFTGKSICEIHRNFKETNKNIDIIYGFDSFEGLPECTNQERKEAIEKHGEYQWKAGDFNSHEWHGVDDARQHLEIVFEKYLDREIKLIEGWFENTLNENTIKEYDLKPALFVDIDVDIYSSCYEVLDFLFKYGIAVPGTTLGFDDWGGTPSWKLLDDGNPRAFKEIIEKYKLTIDHVVRVGDAYPHVANVFLVRSVGGKTYES